MILDSQVYNLPSWAIVPIILGGMAILTKGRNDLMAGIYLSAMTWLSDVQLGPISIGWILIFLLAATSIRSFFEGKAKWSTTAIILLCFLLGWILINLLIIPIGIAGLRWNLIQKVIFMIALPVVSLSQMGYLLMDIKTFIVSFVLTTLIGGILIFVLDANRLGINRILNEGFFLVDLYRLGRVNYHQYGATFVLAFIFSISITISSRSLVVTLGSVIANAFLVYLCILTGSRQILSGIVFASIFYVILVWIVYRRKRFLILFFTMGIIILAIQVALSFAPLSYKLSTGHWDGDRFYYWSAAWSLIRSNPDYFIFGAGFNYYNLAHNLFLESWLTSGIVGLVLLLLFIGWASITAIKSLQKMMIDRNMDLLTWYIPAVIGYIYAIYSAQAIGNLLHGYYIYWGAYLLVMMGELANINRNGLGQSPRPVIGDRGSAKHIAPCVE